MKTQIQVCMFTCMHVGIFSSWDRCKDFVLGYEGVRYKSFRNFEYARNYLYEEAGFAISEDQIDKKLV